MIIARRIHRRWSLVIAALLLVDCGGSGSTTQTAPARSSASPRLAELLSVPAIGRLYGRCQPGDPRWTIEFIATPNAASDSVTYRIGSARPRTVTLNPGDAVTWRLVPGRYTSHEPADPVSHFPATTIKTSAPVALTISQGTEPHIFRANIKFAVAAAIGGTANCALISSSLNATTYYPGGQPPG